jgi:DNA repair protein SbcD/Mre11
MAKLQEIAAGAGHKFVRVRWQVDEEHRQVVDREAIKALFSGAAGLKVESRVLPVVRSRAQGISLETTVEGKLGRWCELASIDPGPLQDRLELPASGDVEAITAGVRAGLASERKSESESPPESPPLATVLTLPAASLDTADEAADEPVESDTKATTASASLDWLNDDLIAAKGAAPVRGRAPSDRSNHV